MPSFSTNNTCLPKISHGSCHKQAQVSSEAPGKMQLTVLPYRPSNYRSFSRPRILTKMSVDELVNEAREGEQSTLPFISASSQSCLRLWVFLPPTQHREDNHLRDKIKWKTKRCPLATHPKPRSLWRSMNPCRAWATRAGWTSKRSISFGSRRMLVWGPILILPMKNGPHN
jgi:hypothetical protein